MRIFLSILLSVSLSVCSAQRKKRDSVLVKTAEFTAMYSEKYEQPLWVKYRVQCPEGHASRAGMMFYRCDTLWTSDDADYFHNVYDKGHMAPAADFSCDKETLHRVFTYANCALQQQDLNRITWKLLEVHERELAKNNTVDVYIKIDFSNQVLKTGARVPSGFYKEIKYNGVKECYYFNNQKPMSDDYTKYRCNCK